MSAYRGPLLAFPLPALFWLSHWVRAHLTGKTASPGPLLPLEGGLSISLATSTPAQNEDFNKMNPIFPPWLLNCILQRECWEKKEMKWCEKNERKEKGFANPWHLCLEDSQMKFWEKDMVMSQQVEFLKHHVPTSPSRVVCVFWGVGASGAHVSWCWHNSFYFQ